MNRRTALAPLLLAFGCSAPTEHEAPEASASDVTGEVQVHGFVKAALPATELDGVAGAECAVLVQPEHRLRPVVLLEPTDDDGACSLEAFPPGRALAFQWSDTRAYGAPAVIARVRQAFASEDATVTALLRAPADASIAAAALRAHLQAPLMEQAATLASSQLATVRVHSRHDFAGEAQRAAQAAFDRVRITQPCENPGSPELAAKLKDGFVYGYVASNSGSCHSGWFSRRFTYNRDWVLVAESSYSE